MSDDHDYRRGYLDGYRDVRVEAGHSDGLRCGEPEAESPDLAALRDGPEPSEDDAVYWLGYAHGRVHAQTGAPATDAQGRVPPGL